MPNRLFIVFAAFACSLLSFGQKESFDFEKTFQKAAQYMASRPDSTKFYLDIMKRNVNEKNTPDSLLARYYNTTGVYYSQISKLDSSKYYFKKAIEQTSKHPKYRAMSFLSYANVLRNEYNYKASLKYLDDALKLYSSLKDTVGIAITYGEMGSNYAYMLENKKAIDHFLKGIKLLENTNEVQRLTIIKQKLANLYLKNKEFEFAIELYEDCLATMKESKDMRNYYLTLINYGDCLILIKEYGKARQALLEAIDGLKLFQSDELLGIAHNKLSIVYAAENNLSTSLNHSKIAFDYIKNTNSFRIMRISAEYIEILNIAEKYKEALEVINFVEKYPNKEIFNIEDRMIYQYAIAKTYKQSNLKDLAINSLEKVIVLRDSISNINREAEILEMQAKFQNKTQQEKNRVLQEKNKFLDEKIKAQNRNHIFLGIIIIILIISMIAFANISRLHNKLQSSKLREAEIENERILKEIEEELKEAEKQKQMVSLRDQELTSVALQLADMQEKIIAIINSTNPELQKAENIKHALSNLVKQEDYWKKFALKFSQIHPNFENNIKERFPILTKNDIDFISLLKLNLSNKEIATLLQISHESVISKKYRVKKKMNIEDDEMFNKIISEL